MRLATLDFESYYDKEYSLSKMTTEAYIRDPRFEVIGVAVGFEDESPEWFSGSLMQTKKFLQRKRLHECGVVAHNAAFDLAILNWIFDIRPAAALCTMSMAAPVFGVNHSLSLDSLSKLLGVGVKGDAVVKALGKRRKDFTPQELEEYGDYCINDAALCLHLANMLFEHLPKRELKVIDLTLRMFTEPLLHLDKPMLEQHLKTVQDEKAAVMVKLQETIGGTAEDLKKTLMSNEKFAEMLTGFGVDPPVKVSPLTLRTTWAFAKTDEAFLALQEHESIEVQAAVTARLGTKSTIAETRTQAFIEIADRGTFPFPVKYSGAYVSHRWSGFDVNPQNLQRKSPLRRSIMAPKGYKILAADQSQVELRLGLWFAGQDDKVEMLRQGRDLYRDFAAEAMQLKYEDVAKDSEERFVGKVASLSLIYSTGGERLQNTIRIQSGGKTRITSAQAQSHVNVYRSTYKKVGDAWGQGNEVLEAIATQTITKIGRKGVVRMTLGGIVKPDGLFLGYPDLVYDTTDRNWTYEGKRGKREKVYGAMVFQRIVQSLARDLIARNMVSCAKYYPIVGTVHDELLMLVKDGEEKEAEARVLKIMRTPPPWAEGLPLDAEVLIGERYLK